jgi:hypothetical protein
MIIAGTATLLIQRKFWPQVGHRSSVRTSPQHGRGT